MKKGLNIDKFNKLLKRLNKEEDTILSVLKIENKSIPNDINSGARSVLRSSNYGDKLRNIFNTKRNITNNIVELQKKLDSLYIMSDSVLYDNIILSYSYTENSESLNKLLSEIE